MIVHNALRNLFTLANPADSAKSLPSVTNMLAGHRDNTVYKAAFARDITKAVTLPAFADLAAELSAYMNSTTVHSQSSFDIWHHSVCANFQRTLNAHSPRQKEYGKAQKAFNMAAKYLYCCDDTLTPTMHAKFDHCHIALDGYTYIERDYPLSFYRDVVIPWKYGAMPRGTNRHWSQLNHAEYTLAINNIREFFDVPAHQHTFNEYLTACHASGLFTSIAPVASKDDRILTPFEAEFFLWEICQKNAKPVFTALF